MKYRITIEFKNRKVYGYRGCNAIINRIRNNIDTGQWDGDYGNNIKVTKVEELSIL